MWARRLRGLLALLPAALVGGAAQLPADKATSTLNDAVVAAVTVQDFVAEDARVAAIAFRLKTANLLLCEQHNYDIGIAVHTLDAYALPVRAAAGGVFGLKEEPAVAAVVPDGPAALAGLRPGDRLIAADGKAFDLAAAPIPAAGTYATTQKALDLIDRASADGHVRFVLLRSGPLMQVDVEARPSCAGRVQYMPSPETNAWSDDRYATISTAIARYAQSDDDLALVMGHELAHLFLGHEALLSRGRPAALVLRTERDADYLGLYLTARAGFDIAGAADFWRRFAAEHGRAAFLLRTHPGGKERARNAAATVAEIAARRRAGQELVPQRPLLGRSRPLIG